MPDPIPIWGPWTDNHDYIFKMLGKLTDSPYDIDESIDDFDPPFVYTAIREAILDAEAEKSIIKKRILQNIFIGLGHNCKLFIPESGDKIGDQTQCGICLLRYTYHYDIIENSGHWQQILELDVSEYT